MFAVLRCAAAVGMAAPDGNSKGLHAPNLARSVLRRPPVLHAVLDACLMLSCAAQGRFAAFFFASGPLAGLKIDGSLTGEGH
jgi:hypothetical protein